MMPDLHRKDKKKGGGKGEKTGGVGFDGGGIIRGSRDSECSGGNGICCLI